MSPFRDAAKKAPAIASPRSFSTRKRGRAARTWLRARARELPAGGGAAPDRRRDLLEADPEDVVQQEGGPLERREPLERQHQRQGDVLLLLGLLDHRLGKPRADIDLAPAPRRLELVEAEPRHGAAQEGLGLAHRAAVGAHPADERLLHHVLGVGDRAEHAVGDAGEAGTQRIEDRRRVPMLPRAGHAAVFRAGISSHPPKPTTSRFQPLMTLITSVSFTCSSSVKWASSAS